MALSSKEAYRMDIEAKLSRYEAKLHELKERAVEKTAEHRVELDEAIVDLEKRMSEVRTKIDELRDVADESARETQTGVENVWRDLVDTFSHVSSIVRRKS